LREIKKLIVHCSDSEFGNAQMIDSWHKQKGWDGIGYHAVICNGIEKWNSEYDKKTDGKIEAGRAIEKPGAHCKGENYDSIAICLIGIKEFTPLQIESLIAYIERQRERFGNILIKGHYEMKSGIEQGKTCPNIDMAEFRKTWSLN